MARTPVGGSAAPAQEFDVSAVKFGRVASAASRDGNKALVPGITTSITLDTDVSIPKLLKVLQAAMKKAEEGGETVKVSLTAYPSDPARKSEKFNKYYNQELKLNVAHLEEIGVITKAEYFAN